MTSVPADGEANMRAGRPIVKKNMSVPHTTEVLRMPTRDTSHIQWFIVPPLSNRRRADLLEYVQRIELVPVLDQLPILHAPYIATSHLVRCTVGLIAHECLTEGSVVAEAGADAVALFDHGWARTVTGQRPCHLVATHMASAVVARFPRSPRRGQSRKRVISSARLPHRNLQGAC